MLVFVFSRKDACFTILKPPLDRCCNWLSKLWVQSFPSFYTRDWIITEREGRYFHHYWSIRIPSNPWFTCHYSKLQPTIHLEPLPYVTLSKVTFTSDTLSVSLLDVCQRLNSFFSATFHFHTALAFTCSKIFERATHLFGHLAGNYCTVDTTALRHQCRWSLGPSPEVKLGHGKNIKETNKTVFII